MHKQIFQYPSQTSCLSQLVKQKTVGIGKLIAKLKLKHSAQVFLECKLEKLNEATTMI